MINDKLGLLILENFVHEPTKDQKNVIKGWSEFILSRDDDGIFLLKGFAGTGKTSLLGALVKTLQELRQRVVLLAPTGRAAKVMSEYSGIAASTIHRRIYRQKMFGDESFSAMPNFKPDTLYIVDEASMIANEGLGNSIFGEGRLLDDLIHYVYSCQGCRLILIGDTAQLPPVGEYQSPALSRNALEGYGLNVIEAQLTQVVRQEESSGILWNATKLRNEFQEVSQGIQGFMDGAEIIRRTRFRVSGFADIKVVPGDELIESLEESYSHSGSDGTIIITRSNKRANIFNNGIRARILCYEEELSGGDRLMIAKNKYEQTHSQSLPVGAGGEPSFYANGEMCVVRRVRNVRELYGFRFADCTLRFEDDENKEQEMTVILDTLQSEAPALTRDQQQLLFQRICEDYPEITNKRDLMKKVREDTYYNALQVKFAYAVTCHKAQGGQWERVYIDRGYLTEDMINEDYIRWLYTAITRATEQVFLINWPDYD